MRVFARAASNLMFGRFQTTGIDVSGQDFSGLLRYALTET